MAMPDPISSPLDEASASDMLDPQALDRLRELDPDGRHGVLSRVLQTFESALVRQRAQMIDAGREGDAAALCAIAHTVKSSAASLGALALSAACAETERAIRNGQTEGLQARVAHLVTEADRALSAVRAMLQS